MLSDTRQCDSYPIHIPLLVQYTSSPQMNTAVHAVSPLLTVLAIRRNRVRFREPNVTQQPHRVSKRWPVGGQCRQPLKAMRGSLPHKFIPQIWVVKIGLELEKLARKHILLLNIRERRVPCRVQRPVFIGY
jgi:hypothetical protein